MDNAKAETLPQGFYKPSEDAQLHCNFTFPISDTLIFSTRYANFKEYVWINGKWREGREFIEEEGLDFFGTFHSLHQMTFANDTFYLMQSISYSCQCRGPAGCHESSCGCFGSEPDWIHVLDCDWSVVHSWQCNCVILDLANGIIYCKTKSHETLLQEFVNEMPTKFVARFNLNGGKLSPLHHLAMKEPYNLKASYSSILRKTVLLVSDLKVNKLFLFLEDDFCWEWQPAESCNVGPIAISESTGHLFAVVLSSIDGTGQTSCVKMLDLRGERGTRHSMIINTSIAVTTNNCIVFPTRLLLFCT